MQNFRYLLYLSIVMMTQFNTTDLQGQDGLPPIIDREIFFGNPEIAGAQISLDGE